MSTTTIAHIDQCNIALRRTYLDDVLMTYGQRYIYAGTEYCCSVYVFKLADDVALVMCCPCYSMDSMVNDFILLIVVAVIIITQ